MACPYLLTCRFYNDQLDRMPGGANLQKLHYCENRSENCARAMVIRTLGEKAVPDDLMPHDVQYARKMLTHFVHRRRRDKAQ